MTQVAATFRSAAKKVPAQAVDQRVRQLLGRMTLQEKVAQLTMVDVSALARDRAISRQALAERFGSLGVGCVPLLDAVPPLSPRESAEAINAIQSYFVNETRLGIPALIIAETLHGVRALGSTIFPQSIALASTWDPARIRQMAQIAAREGRALGVTQGLAPDLDLARDARWGRVEETFGEDPYLVEQLGVAYVEGLQGKARDADGRQRPVDDEHLICTLKHFAAHGTPEGGINLGPVSGGMRELHALYLPPFKAAVQKAGALSIMPAYSELDGIPAHASALLLRQILRDQWGFSGYVFSDYGAVEMLHSFQRTARTLSEAARQALSAGVDVDAPSGACFGPSLAQLVEQGDVSIEQIDQAVSRVLRVKFLAGLFDRDVQVDVEKVSRVVNCPAHRKLARQIAGESIVLLKNDGALLPLRKDLKQIAVIGPNAGVAQLGDYTILKEDVVSPIDGIRALLCGTGTRIVSAPGCTLFDDRRDGFDEAVAAARASEVAIVCVGGTSHFNAGVGWGTDVAKATCGEGFDVSSLRLSGVQEDLVRAVHETGTPTVIVLIDGRPSAIEWIARHVPAILVAWYGGEEGGHALADVLFGQVNPSGKLPISFPRSAGHVPCYYNHKPSARGYYKEPGSKHSAGRDYVFSSPSSLYSFGHGLSYTSFEYSDLKLSRGAIRADETIDVSVDVRNAGPRAGQEVVQLYLRDCFASVTTPVRSLRRFEKIPLDAGESKRVCFTLGAEDFQLLDADFVWRVEPGDFEVFVGPLADRFHVLP